MALGELTQDAFAALIGTTCVTRGDEVGEVGLAITEVQPYPSRPPDEAFSVLFEGPAEPQLDQRMYSVELGDLGTHELFLVPVAASPGTRKYEAVFTRIGDG